MSKVKEYNFGYILLLAVIAALGGFLFGYDEAVISGTVDQVRQQFDLDSMMKGWFVSSALLGAIFGVLAGGALSDYFGRKNTMITAAALFAVSMVGCAFAPGFVVLVLFRIVGGMGIGVASIVCPMYISEISVAKSRGMLVSLYQLAVTIGVLGAYISNYYLLHYAMEQQAVAELDPEASGGWTQFVFVTEWWRGMLGVGVVPSMIFLIAVLFIPESPRWLVLKHRIDRAEGILGRIYNNIAEVKQQVADTLKVASQSHEAGYAALLKPGIRTAVIVGVCIAMLGQFMGVNAVLYYGPDIFKDAGLGQGDAFFYQVIVGLANMLTTVGAMFIIDRVGRKALIYYGVSGMIVALLLIAAYFQWNETVLHLDSIWLLVFFTAYIVCCAGSICAIIFVILSEMYPLAVRGVAMSVAGLALWIATFLVGQLTPWMLTTLTPAGTFLFFAACCFPYVWIMWKKVPDTTGKSLEEIEAYWLKDNV